MNSMLWLSFHYVTNNKFLKMEMMEWYHSLLNRYYRGSWTNWWMKMWNYRENLKRYTSNEDSNTFFEDSWDYRNTLLLEGIPIWGNCNEFFDIMSLKFENPFLVDYEFWNFWCGYINDILTLFKKYYIFHDNWTSFIIHEFLSFFSMLCSMIFHENRLIHVSKRIILRVALIELFFNLYFDF